MKKSIFIILTFLFILLFVGCNDVITIELNGAEEIFVGDSAPLTIISSKSGLDLLWESSNPDVLEVNNGVIYAKSKGESTVTVYLKDDITISSQITINVVVPEGVEELSENINDFLANIIPNTTSNRLILPYSDELVITQSIVYPDTITQLRPGIGKEGVKMPGGIKYIVIHDTGMPDPIYTAAGINSYIHQQANSSTGRVASWHYTVDEKNIYQHVPDDEIAWHAGDGSRAYGTTYYNEDYKLMVIGGGNQNGIGIETCINNGGNYQLTLIRTAKLVASLLYKYNLELDAIKQHYNFSGKNCPAVIRSTSGRWEQFLKHVEFHLYILKSEKNINYEWQIDKPNIVKIDGNINEDLLNDELVNIKLLLEINKVKTEYNYQVTIEGMEVQDKLLKLYLEMGDSLIPNNLSNSINLPLKNDLYNATMEWTSSHPEILSNNGAYVKPAKITIVTLSVVIKIDDTTLTKSYKITIS